jgi:hypothetical protein
MSSKLRIKIGAVEIEYEGTEEFLKKELPELLKTAMELHAASGAKTDTETPMDTPGTHKGKIGSLTTNSIAAKLNAKSGPDLLLAAAAQLALVAKTEPFSRQQLLISMQGATSYYKKNYSGNLSKILPRALKDEKVSETAANTFALTAATKAELEKKLANH